MYILKDQSAAEDMVQNVFLKLWDNRDHLGEIQNLKSYLLSMTKNASLDELSKNVRLEEVNKIPLRFEEDKNSHQEELRLALEKAVSQLSPKCRLIFSLSRFEGLTNDEIANHLALSIRTVETQISLAFKKFRTDLKHCFIEFLVGFLLATELSTQIF